MAHAHKKMGFLSVESSLVTKAVPKLCELGCLKVNMTGTSGNGNATAAGGTVGEEFEASG